MNNLDLPGIPALDLAAADAAVRRQQTLTKPPGSLGRLESLSIQLAAMTGRARPTVTRKAVIVMAADHGVTAEGVSAYPAEVTTQMVANFLGGGAAINVLARQAGARVVIVDIGVAGVLAPHQGLVDSKIARGTANIARGPAMSREELRRAIRIGQECLIREASAGLDVVATGEMGIGNTTASAAVVAALAGAPVARVTGRGTGMSDEGLRHKVATIEAALRVNRPDSKDPLGVLASVGGFEIAGLVGVILAAATRRIPVVIDGFISGAAALAAAALEPAVVSYLIASHRSVEPGHALVLERLGLQPLLDLDLRLGEGTGAALAFHLIEAAVRLLDEMATFSEAGVSERAVPVERS
jgi:nicotinate-nucleotide--dimethylbenzimidazole phosphoribosyltransferase